MYAVPILFILGFTVYIAIRTVRSGHEFDDQRTTQFLIEEAENKYPFMSLIDALDALYDDYYDRIIAAQRLGHDLTDLIKRRQIIAREHARLVTIEQESETGFEVIHSAQA